MPVLIAGFERDLDIIRPLAERLRADGGEVRCYLEDDDYELRSLGCKIAVGNLEDPDMLTAALTNVHTFMPVLADAATFVASVPLERLSGFANSIEGAVAEADLSQCIAPVSGVGAGQLAEALDRVARVIRLAMFPACVIRTGLISGPDRPIAASAVVASDEPGQTVHLTSVETLVTTLAAADDLESLEGELTLGGFEARLQAGISVGEHLDARATLGNSVLEGLNLQVADAQGQRRSAG
jgi:hypothetical protein